MTDEITPTTGVYSSGQIPWEWIDGEFIDLAYEAAVDELKAQGMSDEDIDAEMSYWDGGTDHLYGDWLQDDDGLWYPDPNGEFALLYDSNDGYGQLVYSKWVHYGRPASPCFPGQVDARDDDPLEPDGEPQYSVPTDQIFCMAPDRCCVPYYAFPAEAYV
jgi:hypothetical protein